MGSDFYLRYYVGHKGKFGHEFLEFEFRPDGGSKLHLVCLGTSRDGVLLTILALWLFFMDLVLETTLKNLKTNVCFLSFRDPEGLRVFYYLVQDLKCLVFSLIGLHFKIKPI
ncbi:protein mago nashi homolog 1-like [Terrapene carolina triunguis]|uniref:protein mago nashi homolog 1-like n=1 Tax=Terrapene triunguis TaxID=2587831 RepID=UPI001156A819|nr:protein mago nashi homolog 1-like [Terrapene carolina triunguis]